MKYIYTFCFFLSFVLGSWAQNLSKIDSPLLEKIQNSENEYFEIYLHLSDRVNIYSILEEMRTGRLSADDRARHVVTSLRNKADETQGEILKVLFRKNELVHSESIKSLWITNAIQLSAHRDLIYEITTWESIEKIYTLIDGHTTIEDQIEFSTNEDRTVTSGIKAINAPALWKLGYTGYGRKAFVMDSGAQYDHPALRTQYAGNFLPFNQAWTGGGDEPFDVGGHGTHVTGTIMGLDRKNKDTIGVAFNANWIGGPVQFGNSPPQPHFVQSFIGNMQFALDPDGNPETTDDIPDVFNNSWGHTNFNPEFCNPSAFFSEVHLAIEAAGIAMVWSAGNNGDAPMSVTGYMNSNFDLVSSFAVGNVSQSAPFAIAGSSSRGPSQCGGEGSLLIKPEVSAPGINVRSSYLNGSYAQLTGTSMSAPHVSGAVLLLKEAFPFLSGDIILMALYLTAFDLGEHGEDNDYGMGLIDVLAAYNYLIDEGYTPMSPVSNQTDIVLDNIIFTKTGICLGYNQLEFDFSNSGNDTIFSFSIQYGLEELPQSIDQIEWVGVLPPGKSQNLILDSFLISEPGTYNLQALLLNPNGTEDSRSLNNSQHKIISVSEFEFLEIETDILPCLGGEVTITAGNISDPNNLIEWFGDRDLNTLLGEGPNLVLPSTREDQNIFVQQSMRGSLGASLNSGQEISFDDLDNAGLYFNVFDGIHLKSVKVHTNETGNIIFQILNSNNVAVISKVHRINETGINTIPIDVFIPEGFNYKFNVINARILGSSIENVNFPYNFSNYVEIYASYDEINTFYTDRYNFFFDWEIAKVTCNATEYQIPVDESYSAPEVEIIKSVDTLFLSNPLALQLFYSSPSPGLVSWDFGNGESSNEPNPIPHYDEKGIFTITVKVVFDATCVVYAYENVVVIDDRISSSIAHSEESKIMVYPNPFQNFIILESDTQEKIGFQIYNSIGQMILFDSIDLAANASFQISTFSLPPGSYYLYLNRPSTKSVHKIFKF